MVVDALSKKTVVALLSLRAKVSMSGNGSLLAELIVKSTFLSQILEEHMKDVQCALLKKQMISGKAVNFSLGKHGELRFTGRIFVPVENDLRREFLREAPQGPFSLYPESIKMYLPALDWEPRL
ncbi:uncharacterized protein LOC128039935 [Gossypium raimondii]|uniref:uncharacterized protein LOC128039935 n=1 Tax=Gossypium raimondii TaxID=29730 RepID=UPI00227B17FA|nr:uncharacterized protein LOC128039935 [Gossypium raimondii]